MRQPAVLGLRRRGHHQRLHARSLRRHHVHDHARRVDRQAARRVEPDPAHRHEPLGDRAARHDLGDDVRAALVGVHRAGPLDRVSSATRTAGSSVGQRPLERRRRHPDPGGRTLVEPLGELQSGLGPALAHAPRRSGGPRAAPCPRPPRRGQEATQIGRLRGRGAARRSSRRSMGPRVPAGRRRRRGGDEPHTRTSAVSSGPANSAATPPHSTPTQITAPPSQSVESATTAPTSTPQLAPRTPRPRSPGNTRARIPTIPSPV